MSFLEKLVIELWPLQESVGQEMAEELEALALSYLL